MKQYSAELDGDFVVFLIGMRINKPWKFWKWAPVAAAMPRMLIELAKQPELGLLHARSHLGFGSAMVIQYWKSVDATIGERIEDKVRAGSAPKPAEGMGER